MSSKTGRTTATVVALTILVGIYLLLGGGYGDARLDAESTTGYYIPEDLDDALIELDRVMGVRGRLEIRWTATEDDMAGYHFGIGQWMRNDWGLWRESRLKDYFLEIGIQHPDDMSAIILDSYWRQLHGVPIDLEGQVSYYEAYWQSVMNQED